MGKSFQKIIESILFMGILFLIGYAFSTSGILEDITIETRFEKYLVFAGVLIIVHLVLMIHELGHLLVGILQGFRFDMFVVGLLGIKREEDKVKLYLNKNLGHYGGLAATSPKNDSSDNANKFAKILLAGPLASLILAIILFLFISVESSVWKIIFLAGSLTSIGIFLATTIPSKTGMFFTDRKRYQRLVSKGKDRDVEMAILHIMGKFGQDNSYRNVDYKNIELIIADEDKLINVFGLFNAICFQIEHRKNIDESILEKYDVAKKKLPKSLIKTLDNEVEKFKLRINNP